MWQSLARGRQGWQSEQLFVESVRISIFLNGICTSDRPGERITSEYTCTPSSSYHRSPIVPFQHPIRATCQER